MEGAALSASPGTVLHPAGRGGVGGPQDPMDPAGTSGGVLEALPCALLSPKRSSEHKADVGIIYGD